MKVQRLRAPTRSANLPPPPPVTPVSPGVSGEAANATPAGILPLPQWYMPVPVPSAKRVLRVLAEPETMRRAGVALPLLLAIVNRCLQADSPRCELLLGELAEQLGHAPNTMTPWHQRLQAEFGLSVCRKNGRLCFELPPALLAEVCPSHREITAVGHVPGEALAPSGMTEVRPGGDTQKEVAQ